MDTDPLTDADRERFADFWDSIVMPNGEWDHDQVVRELLDYETLLTEVPKVYCEVTGGRMSKPHYPAKSVLEQHDEWCPFAQEVAKVRELAEAALEDARSFRPHATNAEAVAIIAFAAAVLVALGDFDPLTVTVPDDDEADSFPNQED